MVVAPVAVALVCGTFEQVESGMSTLPYCRNYSAFWQSLVGGPCDCGYSGRHWEWKPVNVAGNGPRRLIFLSRSRMIMFYVLLTVSSRIYRRSSSRRTGCQSASLISSPSDCNLTETHIMQGLRPDPWPCNIRGRANDAIQGMRRTMSG